MAVTVNILGIQKLISDLSSLSSEGDRMANAVVGVVSNQITNAQKLSAPTDLGTIRQNLGNRQISPALYEIFSNAPESPYQEFGTGPQVMVGDHGAEAAEFQGTGTGDWNDFILALTDWVKRHGGAYGSSYSIATHKRTGNATANRDLDREAAIMIARSILKRGLKPQPFFYYNVDEGFAKLEPMLQKAYDELINKNI